MRKKKFIPPNKTLFTQEELEFIATRHQHYTNRELLALLNDGREKKCGYTVFRNMCRALGLKHAGVPIKWTEQQTNFLINNFQFIGDVELAELLNLIAAPGQFFTRKHVSKKRTLLNLSRSISEIDAIAKRNSANGRYEKGLQYGRMGLNQLTPAQRFLATNNIMFLQK